MRSLRISATRLYLEGGGAALPLARFAPPSLDGIDRLGPVFLVTSSAEGMAGLAEFQVRVLDRQRNELFPMPRQRILVSDGPVVVAPGTLSVADVARVDAFELWAGRRHLGELSLGPVPTASFTAEGGFESPKDDFAWSASAEELLRQRLGQLSGRL
jgi:hypothetical protein